MMSSNTPVYGTVLTNQCATVTMTVPADQVESVAALGGTVATTAAVAAPSQQPSRQMTKEECRKGHPLVLVDYFAACAVITMNKGNGTDVYGTKGHHHASAKAQQGLHCSHCLYQVEPQDRVFLCEKCTMSKDQNSLPPVVFCETCVANRHHDKTNEWSSSCSSMLNGSCVDATLCHYCTLVGTELYTHPREDGEQPGEGDRCGLWCWVCLAVWTDIWAPCLLSTMWLNNLRRTTAALNNIDDPGCCRSFCLSYWCRCCVLGQVRRQWKTRESAAMGKVEGCLCGPMRSAPVRRFVPQSATQTTMFMVAPPALPLMDHRPTKTTGAPWE